MTVIMKRVNKGIVLRGETSDPTFPEIAGASSEGSLFNNKTSARFKVYIEAAVREVVTANQIQTLTNKTINADQNTISNIANAQIKAGANIDLTKLANGALPVGITVTSANISDLSILNEDVSVSAAIARSKLAAGTANRLVVNNVSGVQSDAAAITINKVLVSDANGIPVAAAPSTTEIDYVSGVTSAIQTQLDSKASNSNLTSHSSTSSGVHGVTGTIVGTSDTQTLTNKTINADLNTISNIADAQIKAGAAIARTKLAAGTANRVLVNDGSGVHAEAAAITPSKVLVSDANGIPVAATPSTTEINYVSGVTSSIQTQIGTKLNSSGGTLTNGSIVTPVRLDVKQDTRANLDTYASSASNGQIVFATDEKQMYQVVDSALISIGGQAIVKPTAGETLSLNDVVYISTGTGNDSGRTAGRAYKVDASNDDRVEVLGFISKAGASGAVVEVQTSGLIKGLSGLSSGKVYYASPSTPGAITLTPPAVGGQWVVAIGLASSATEFIMNPVASVSAIFLQEDFSFTIANNQSSVTNVTGLLFDGIQTRSFSIEYSIYRQTNTASSALAQIGQLRGVYNSQSATWFMSDDFAGQNSGVSFSITNLGQLRYTSSNISGANYVGTMKYTIKRTFKV